MLRAPSLRPVQVVLVGNCVDRGLGLRPGESYADQVRESVQSRHPETLISIRHVNLIHPTLLPTATSEALRTGSDIVVLGSSSNSLIGPVAVNRLWDTPFRESYERAVNFVQTIDQRLSAESVRGKTLRSSYKIRHPWRHVLAPLTVNEFRECFDRAIQVLRSSRVRVILRGPAQPLDQIGDASINSRAIFDELGTKYQLHTVFPTEVLNERFDGLLQETARERLNASGHHRLIGPIDSAVEATVCAVLRDRAGGVPPVLAQAQVIRRRSPVPF